MSLPFQANLPVPTATGMPSSSRGSARSSLMGGSPASSVRSGGSRAGAAAVNIGFDGELGNRFICSFVESFKN